MKKFIHHDLGPRGLRLKKMGHPAQGRGICVDNARCFKIFSKLLKRGIFEQVSTFFDCELSHHLNSISEIETKLLGWKPSECK